MKALFVTSFVYFLSLSPYTDVPKDWGNWYNLGQGVSVRYSIVQKNWENSVNHYWTWQFRNEEASKISYLEFKVTENKADGTREEFKDWFPGNLEGYKAFGGWAAFSAVSRTEPAITILKIERK